MTYARVDDDGNAVRETDGSLEMRPAQPMEYANGVCYSRLQICGFVAEAKCWRPNEKRCMLLHTCS